MADDTTPASNPGGLSDDQVAALRDALGLTETADPDVFVAALLALAQKFQADRDAFKAERDRLSARLAATGLQAQSAQAQGQGELGTVWLAARP